MLTMAPPNMLGLPERYTDWRKNQAAAVDRIIHNDKNIILSICPTGFGKSLTYVAAGLILGGKTVILTSTKALQSQLMNDFESIGMVDVRGKNSYRCKEANKRISCDQGMCNFGMFCPLKKGGCDYYDAVIRARNAQLVVTNYAFWLHTNEYSEGIGVADLLVCDEGHDAPEEVASFLQVKLDRSDDVLIKILPMDVGHMTIPRWREWAGVYVSNIEKDLERLQMEIMEDGPDEYLLTKVSKCRKLLKDLSVLSTMDPLNWVVNVTPFDIEFAPIWVRDRCQEILFGKARNVLITSGSVNFKTADMLGIKKSECTIDEYPHTFPVESRLVYCLEGGRINATADGDTLNEWIQMADSIIEARLDRKGIFHTTAYHRRDYVIARSRFTPYMMSHNRHDLVANIRKFKDASPPKVFVSPSITTGFDFPYEDCEYQILGKVPYPDTRNIITKARCDKDPDYAPYVAMQQIVQACGRGSRAEDDYCENFIIDSNINWFLRRHRKFAPKWFLESITQRVFPPDPPQRMKRRKGQC